jgi:hypothetical protein
MMCAQETDQIQISDHALKRFCQRRVRLGLDAFGNDWQLLEAELRRIFATSARLDITSLRNWKKRKRQYPGSTYFRNERFVLVVNSASYTLVTCFLFQGRRASHRKPRTRDERARHKMVLHRHLHEGGEL